MANNYTEFSEILMVDDGDVEWLKKRIANFEDPPGEQEIDREDYLKVADKYGVEYDQSLSFNVEFKEGEAWFYTDESGDPWHVANLVQELFVARRPEDCFHISWAATSSKPKVGEFGGGAIFVTADDIDFVDSWHFLDDKMKAWREKVE